MTTFQKHKFTIFIFSFSFIATSLLSMSWKEFERTWPDQINFDQPNQFITLPGGQTSTPLIMAVIRFNEELTEKLLHAHADPNLSDGSGLQTPLIEAIEMFNNQSSYNTPDCPSLATVLNIMTMLLNHGADPSKPNYYGRTALDYAKNYDAIEQLLKQYKKPVGSVLLPSKAFLTILKR